MTTIGRRPVLMAMLGGAIAVLLPADSHACAAAADAASLARPVVEYAKVEGQQCLQARVMTGLPEDVDLVAGQKRWLAKNYPGYRLVRQLHLLTPPAPGSLAVGHETVRPAGEDVIELTRADGESDTVCFSLVLPVARDVDDEK